MQKSITIILAVGSMLGCRQPQPAPVVFPPKTKAAGSVVLPLVDSLAGFTNIDFTDTHMLEQMAYADTSNFMHTQIYPCASCYLRPEAAAALLKANQLAQQQHLRLLIFDCYRPKQYQQKMYDLVQNPDYVANPAKGSMHNKGLAVDIALADSNGTMLDFGTGFDDFSEKAHVDYPGISATAKKNRQQLQHLMTAAGFKAYANEWWHFNFPNTNYPADDIVWDCH